MEKTKDTKIKLSKEKRDELTYKIKKYFLKEREEDLGDLGASLILDFIINELSAEFYNQAIYDCYGYMNDRVEDILGLQK